MFLAAARFPHHSFIFDSRICIYLNIPFKLILSRIYYFRKPSNFREVLLFLLRSFVWVGRDAHFFLLMPHALNKAIVTQI